MEKRDFNKNWICRCLTREEPEKKVTLPHDAMRSELRSEESRGEGNIGWYIGGDYEYTKHFFVPEEDVDKKAVLEFEGVYHNAEIYVNEKKAAFRPYGYTNFYVELNRFLRYGAENSIRVIARNADQPNSRWYSGTGIYRPVNLYLGEKEHIPVNGIRIQTVSLEPAQIRIEVKTSIPGNVKIQIHDGEQIVVSEEKMSEREKGHVKDRDSGAIITSGSFCDFCKKISYEIIFVNSNVNGQILNVSCVCIFSVQQL